LHQSDRTNRECEEVQNEEQTNKQTNKEEEENQP
jgi:hypothetical protein